MVTTRRLLRLATRSEGLVSRQFAGRGSREMKRARARRQESLVPEQQSAMQDGRMICRSRAPRAALLRCCAAALLLFHLRIAEPPLSRMPTATMASPLGLARSTSAARSISTLMRRSAIPSIVSPCAATMASASRSAPLAISQCARTAFSSNLSQSIRALSQSSNTAEPAVAAAKAADVDLSQLPKDAQSSATRTKDATFASLRGSIDYSLLKALTVKPFGYETMSAVQQSVLHLLPELASGVGANATPMPDGQGRDMLVKAKTGTGKTIAFLVPALEARLRSIQDVSKGRFSKPWLDMLKRHRPDLDVSTLSKKELDEITKQYVNNTVGALILSPTRELATQIADEAKKLLTHAPDLKLDDLPVNQLHVDDLAQEVETLSAKFDENPQEFAVPDEVFEAARQAKKELKKGGRGRDSFSAPGVKPPAEIRGPLTGKYESSELKPLIAKTLANMEESEASREVFTSLLGFYMGRGDELRTNKLAVLDGLKQWCVQAARMEKAPHLSDSFLQKMGMSMRDMRGGSSSSRGGRGGSGGGYRADSSRSFGRGRFSRDGDSRGDSRDFRGSRDSRDNRDFRGSRDGRDSRGGRSNFGTGRDARQSRFGPRSSRFIISTVSTSLSVLFRPPPICLSPPKIPCISSRRFISFRVRARGRTRESVKLANVEVSAKMAVSAQFSDLASGPPFRLLLAFPTGFIQRQSSQGRSPCADQQDQRRYKSRSTAQLRGC
ncbi:hypothetical protein L1887_56672 [Cichorium endivia]|nr:hypothetical protein L1887_56672 [Cichorium endivia]